MLQYFLFLLVLFLAILFIQIYRRVILLHTHFLEALSEHVQHGLAMENVLAQFLSHTLKTLLFHILIYLLLNPLIYFVHISRHRPYLINSRRNHLGTIASREKSPNMNVLQTTLYLLAENGRQVACGQSNEQVFQMEPKFEQVMCELVNGKANVHDVHESCIRHRIR